MHTTEFNGGWRVHFNGDYSGDVIVIKDGPAVGSPPEKKLEVPFEVLKALVANYVRDQQIGRLESASDNEVLGVKSRG